MPLQHRFRRSIRRRRGRGKRYRSDSEGGPQLPELVDHSTDDDSDSDDLVSDDDSDSDFPDILDSSSDSDLGTITF